MSHAVSALLLSSAETARSDKEVNIKTKFKIYSTFILFYVHTVQSR